MAKSLTSKKTKTTDLPGEGPINFWVWKIQSDPITVRCHVCRKLFRYGDISMYRGEGWLDFQRYQGDTHTKCLPEVYAMAILAGGK